MIIWLDDIRAAPSGYVWCRSVNMAKQAVYEYEKYPDGQLIIDCDHDMGDYYSDGGDGIKLLDWLERTGRDYCVKVHTMNPVGRNNMNLIIERNGWNEDN